MWENIVSELFYLIRILLALALGIAIGAERKMRYKEAGIRTHAIVAVGSALIVLVGKYGFEGGDTSRVAAQIVTGIGFLGAGIIMYGRGSLRGVTTAAGIWATAGIGMAAGTGQYVLAVGATILIVGAQFVLHLPFSIFKSRHYFFYRIKFSCAGNENEKIKEFFGIKTYSKINYHNTEEGISASAEISINRIFADEQMKELIEKCPFITSIERIYLLNGKD